MAYRTSQDLVRSLLETNENVSVPDDFDLEQFILPANVVVTKICLPKYSSPADDVQLETIERWLGCHFYRVSDPGKAAERALSAAGTYETKIGFNLLLTRYGQTAMVIDTSGALAAWQQELETKHGMMEVGWPGTEINSIRLPGLWDL